MLQAHRYHQRGSVGVVVIVIAGAVIIGVLWLFKPKTEVRALSAPKPPIVDVLTVEPMPYQAQVKTQGTVVPQRQINVVAEVSGRVVKVSKHFIAGGFFNADEVLVQLDDRDYQFQLINARSQVAAAERELALERGRARQAQREWRDLGSAEANALSLRKPQVKAAQAALVSAKAERDRALLDIERSKISVPFAGRVDTSNIDLGQFVSAGSNLGRVYDSAVAEIRLPLSNEQLSLLNFTPASHLDERAIPVKISASIAGQASDWSATLSRTEASIDSATRFFNVIAEVDQPFDTNVHDRALYMGLFVNAVIPGRVFENSIRIPAKAVINDSVFMLTADNRLEPKPITVIQREGEFLWVQSQLSRGDRVVTSDPRVLREGLSVAVKTVTDRQQQ
ncbi:MAG: efflux RND transporter periplasmic adaptor subunit [Pseudomonadota bacterium]